MTRPEQQHRGLFIFVNEDGSISHETIGVLGQAEILGITKYVELLPSEAKFSSLMQSNKRLLEISSAMVDAIKQVADIVEGEPSCGTESSEESLPSQD